MRKLLVQNFFKFQNKIPSLNEYYKPGRGHIYLNPEVKRYKAEITKQLFAQVKNPDEIKKELLSGGIMFKIIYLLNEKRALRDEDNLRKATQDAIFDFYKINDMLITDSVSQRNQIRIPSMDEYILTLIYTHDESRLFDLPEGNFNATL